ncbi:hypothetical protein B0H66DRAFT_566306 [Apodospora peruviana]|uniref:Uncharacterized protein n=1 Tax=Apodospora peruviana TaxID=516989 RepID=A0AAE0HV55_9PEZI|nr:hypothetical protein B0H66DRAFT_566306 [Apodospora peruviana]
MISTTTLSFLSALLAASTIHAADSPSPKKTSTVDLFLLGKSSPIQTPTGVVLGVDAATATKTTYTLYCSGQVVSHPTDPRLDSFRDPCPLIGGTIIAEPTRWEYDVSKSTNHLANPVTQEFTTGTIICDVESNKAKCAGMLTSLTTIGGENTRSETSEVKTTVADVQANRIAVTMTSGLELLDATRTAAPSSTTVSTESQTGGAAAAAGMVTQAPRVVFAAAAGVAVMAMF